MALPRVSGICGITSTVKASQKSPVFGKVIPGREGFILNGSGAIKTILLTNPNVSTANDGEKCWFRGRKTNLKRINTRVAPIARKSPMYHCGMPVKRGVPLIKTSVPKASSSPFLSSIKPMLNWIPRTTTGGNNLTTMRMGL